jgi:hypothetical protein
MADSEPEGKLLKLCSIDGCGKPVRARGWCAKHHQRWSRYGDPNVVRLVKVAPAVKSAALAEGRKYCASAQCAEENPQPLEAFGRDKRELSGYYKYCKKCKRAWAVKYDDHRREHDARWYQENRQLVLDRMKQYYAENAEAVKARVAAWYAEHPETVAAYRPTANASRRTPEGRAQGRKDSHKRRARMQQAGVEDFDDLEIFERDAWVCQLCWLPVDPELQHPDRMSKSLDHVIPILLGGPHTRDNTQLAHLVCNIKKGNKEHVLARRKGGVLSGRSGQQRQDT